MSYIYLVTNNINGKRYVGQHHYEKDGIDPSYKGSGVLLKQAYQKYGMENFSFEVLEFCSDSSMDELEKNWIQTLDTQAPNGYNIRSGGYGMSEEDRKMASHRQLERYKTGPEYHQKIIEHLSKFHGMPRKELIFICPLKLAYLNKQNLFLYELGEAFGCDFRIIKQRAAKYGIQLNPRYPFTGRKHTAEYKDKMRKIRMKPVRQISKITNETISEWPSIQDAANYLKIDYSKIIKCCKGKANTCGGFKWEYIN